MLSDEALIADVHAASQDDGHVHLWWLGQSGFLVQWRGRHLLFDPYLSDALTKKYADTDRPHVRMTARAVDPAALTFIDVVTSSHTHTDHLDADTLGAIGRASPGVVIVVPEVNRMFAADRLGIAPDLLVGVDVGEAHHVGPFVIEAVPAAHEVLAPQIVGYIVRCGRWTLYHSGDTVMYDGMIERLRSFAIDVAMLPINGRAPERGVAGNLSGDEAAHLGAAVGARTVIPCHYEMFTFNTADPAGFVAACARHGQRCDVVRCGERWSTTRLEP